MLMIKATCTAKSTKNHNSCSKCNGFGDQLDDHHVHLGKIWNELRFRNSICS